MCRAARCLVAILTVTVLLGGGLGGPPGGAVAAAPTADSTAPDTRTHVEIALRADGDAVWTVHTRIRLNGSNATRAFRRLGRAFTNGEVETSAGSVDVFRRLARTAAERTGRSMRIRNVSRSWRIERPSAGTTGAGTPAAEPSIATPTPSGAAPVGVLTLRFEWTGFGRTDGEDVVIDDVFRAGNGWFPRLYAGQTLAIRAPNGYSVESAAVGPENATLRWSGPARLGPDQLTARFARSGAVDIEIPGLPVGVASALLILAVVGAAVAVRRWWGGTAAAESGDRERVASADAAGGIDDDGPAPDGIAADADDSAPPSGAADPVAGIDETLLSDEERIERHLEAAGGRMRQAAIVEATGWSNAKVSQVLSGMAETGRVEKLRIGRENLISLPDARPDTGNGSEPGAEPTDDDGGA